MTAKYDLTILAGQGFDASNLYFTWETTAGPVDLTGYTARAQIRSSFAVGSPSLADWTTENGKLLLGGTLGTVTIVVPATETTALWVDGLPVYKSQYLGRARYVLGYWDIELISPTAAVKRFVQGEVYIVPEATR